MNVNEFFPRKVCINLDRRMDRWNSVQAEFARHRISDVQRIAGVDGMNLELPAGWTDPPGAFGCLQSHLKVIEQARRSCDGRVLILEDDVVFADNMQRRFAEIVTHLPATWDMLYFGGLHLEKPQTVSGPVARVSQTYSTFAYALRNSIYGAFIELNRRGERPVDDNNTILQKEFECYCCQPPLAWVSEDYSDAQGCEANHWYLKEDISLDRGERAEIGEMTTVIVGFSQCPSRSPPSPRRLAFWASFYAKHIPGCRIAFVTDNECRIDGASLPAGCEIVSAPRGQSIRRQTAFQLANQFRCSDSQFFVVVDGDLYIDSTPLIASLQLCRQYEHVTLAKDVVQLDRDDTNLVLSGKGRSVDTRRHAKRKLPSEDFESAAFTATALTRMKQFEMGTLELNEFRAPTLAMRLCPEQHTDE